MWRVVRYVTLGVLIASSVAGSLADPLDEVRSTSKLQNLDPQKLKGGEIVSSRGPLGTFTRGLYVESCYFIRASTGDVANAMLHWDPTKHRELEVGLFREYRWPAGAEAFSSLSLSAARREDQWLIDRTWQLSNAQQPTELHLAQPEMDSVRAVLSSQPARSAQHRASAASQAWRSILQGRSEAIAAGGLAAVTTYSAVDAKIAAQSEFRELLKLNPAIASRFASLCGSKPFTVSGTAPDETVPYWESSQVRGHTGLHNGVLCGRKGPGSWQFIDLTYYTSDTYFMSMSLYEMWPLDDGTLVWQIDFVSAPFHSITSGIERVFAGREMLKESAQWIQLFRADVEQHR
jgi:hypothetical protein